MEKEPSCGNTCAATDTPGGTGNDAVPEESVTAVATTVAPATAYTVAPGIAFP